MLAVNIEIIRTFVRVRALAATHSDLAKRLAELEEKTEALAINHDTFSHNTRAQLKKVFDALRELMTPPEPPKRPIGFVMPEDKSKKGSAAARRKKLIASRSKIYCSGSFLANAKSLMSFKQSTHTGTIWRGKTLTRRN